MNYKESIQILEEIRKANKILVNCHRGPDPDSIGSALALGEVLQNMGKEVEIICPSEELYENIDYLKGFEKIKKGINFNSFDFSKYDLLMTLDSSSLDMVTGLKDFKFENDIKVIVIDHHETNTNYGEINLVDKKNTSTGETLFLVFEDWGVILNKDIADSLMTGIVGDTGAFRFPGSNTRTFRVAGELMKLGADKDKAINNLYRSDSFEMIKFYSEVLERFEMDKERKFVWSAVPYSIYEKYSKPVMAKESSASLFSQIVKDTDFGFIAVEQEKDKLAISFRSRTGFDTSIIASRLGGGGHIFASGARIEGLPFDKAVEKLLNTVREIVDEKKSK